MTDSRRKGARGERQFCKRLNERGYGAYRSAQHAGIARRDDSADVITSIEGVRFEVKRGKNNVHIWHKQVQDWIEKAKDETPDDKMWCIAWRPDRADWHFILQCAFFQVSDFVLVPDFEAMLNWCDPERDFTVDNPDEWIK